MIDLLNGRAQQLEEAEKCLIWRMEPLTGGLNNRFGPQYIGENEYSDGLNVDLSDPTRAQTRDGYKILGDSTAEMQDGLDANLLAKRICGFCELDPSAAVSPAARLLVISISDPAGTSRVYRRSNVASAGSWTECVDGGAASVQFDTDELKIFQGNDHLLFCSPDASHNTWAMDSAGLMTDGANVDDTGIAPGSPPRNVADGLYAYNREWLITRSNVLCYSKVNPTAANVATNWSRTGTYSAAGANSAIAGRFLLAPNVGAVAVAAKAHVNGSIICYFDSCIEAIAGLDTVAGYADPEDNASRIVVTSSFGCGAYGTLVSAGADHLFMDQYGQVRRLSQTVNGEQAGVDPVPLSEKIAAYLPGRLNLQAIAKCKSVIHKQRMLVAFPLDSSTEANAVAVYNLAYGYWEGIWVLTRPVSQWVVSNIRGNGEDLWFADGGNASETPAAKVYRMFPGTYTDDGTVIPFEFVPRSLTFDAPEAFKKFQAAEIGVIAGAGMRVFLDVQLNESGFYQTHPTVFTTPATGTSSFPLVFPLAFPLVDVAPAISYNLWRMDEYSNKAAARYLRLKIRTATLADKSCKVADLFVTAKPEYRKELE